MSETTNHNPNRSKRQSRSRRAAAAVTRFAQSVRDANEQQRASNDWDSGLNTAEQAINDMRAETDARTDPAGALGTAFEKLLKHQDKAMKAGNPKAVISRSVHGDTLGREESGRYVGYAVTDLVTVATTSAQTDRRKNGRGLVLSNLGTLPDRPDADIRVIELSRTTRHDLGTGESAETLGLSLSARPSDKLGNNPKDDITYSLTFDIQPDGSLETAAKSYSYPPKDMVDAAVGEIPGLYTSSTSGYEGATVIPVDLSSTELSAYVDIVAQSAARLDG